tara:strand:- start:22601 stop:23428 length:828 start_codon:yes stop_codon:yes gene_type:complete
MKVWKKVVLIIVGLFIIWYFIQIPTNHRNWTNDQKVLSYAEIEDDLVHMKNIRNNVYRSTEDYDVHYYDKTFDIDELETIDFMVEPFAQWEGAAHTFLTFGFGPEESREYVVISVEIRKEIGEHFSTWKGMLKQYELQYVFGDERDLIKLRTNYRKDNVYLLPIKGDNEKFKLVFMDMVKRTNKLKEDPEFYNTLTSSCTTNIVDHVNKISPKRIPTWDFRIIAPGYSGKLAHEVGLIDTEFSWENAKQYYKINSRAEQYGDSEDFSKRIRDYGS